MLDVFRTAVWSFIEAHPYLSFALPVIFPSAIVCMSVPKSWKDRWMAWIPLAFFALIVFLCWFFDGAPEGFQ